MILVLAIFSPSRFMYQNSSTVPASSESGYLNLEQNNLSVLWKDPNRLLYFLKKGTALWFNDPAAVVTVFCRKFYHFSTVDAIHRFFSAVIHPVFI